MIYKSHGFNLPLEFDESNNSFTLFSYNRIVIRVGQFLEVSLPYFRQQEIPLKHYNCEIIKKYSRNLSINWTNINDLDSKNKLTFELKNNNIILEENLMNKISGENKVDILPSMPIIRVFI